MMTIFAVFADMEEDRPVAYCLAEEDAKRLLEGSTTGDSIAIEVSEAQWMALLTGKRD